MVLCAVRAVLAADRDLSALFSSTVLIRRGDKNDRVRYLQEALDACGYNVSPDGVFGPLTESAVREFQRDSGLYVDGIAGPATIRELEKTLLQSQSARQIYREARRDAFGNRRPLRHER